MKEGTSPSSPGLSPKAGFGADQQESLTTNNEVARPGLMQAGGLLNSKCVDPSNLEPVLAKDSRLLVAAFYAFTPLDDERREALLSSLPSLAREGSVLGTGGQGTRWVIVGGNHR